jgi:signal transduction histidine kinase
VPPRPTRTQRGGPFDPATVEPRAEPGAPDIEAVSADDRQITVANGLSIPARTSRVVIAYSVVDLETPWKRRFRYRLDPFDGQWVDANGERQAVYTGLPPGTYRFHVAASRRDDSWAGAATMLAFSVRPTMYQSIWFRTSLVGVFGLLAWAAWRMRVRLIRRQFATLLGERARLSREIHDTLLQCLVGVVLQFEALSNGLEPGSAARAQIARIRRQVDGYIRDARHTICGLRASGAPQEFPQALRAAAERVSASGAGQLEFEVRGAARPLAEDVEEPLIRMTQEGRAGPTSHNGDWIKQPSPEGEGFWVD